MAAIFPLAQARCQRGNRLRYKGEVRQRAPVEGSGEIVAEDVPCATGQVIAVSRAPRHGFAKGPQASIQLIAGEGVEGDAHRGVTVQHLYQKRRDATQPNLCQVHLFAAEKLEELAAAGYALGPGEIGENVLTRGLALLDLPRGTRLHLGTEAKVVVTGLRTPCKQIDGYREGMQALLWGPRDGKGKRERRAGVMAVVEQGGTVRGGDFIKVELPALPHHKLGPV